MNPERKSVQDLILKIGIESILQNLIEIYRENSDLDFKFLAELEIALNTYKNGCIYHELSLKIQELEYKNKELEKRLSPRWAGNS